MDSSKTFLDFRFGEQVWTVRCAKRTVTALGYFNYSGYKRLVPIFAQQHRVLETLNWGKRTLLSVLADLYYGKRPNVF